MMKIANVGTRINLKGEAKIFIENSLEYLLQEFNLWGSIDDAIFEYNERAYVGFFNNAIIRNYGNRYSTLQEYVVYDKGNFVGRADLLVFDKQIPCFYLFEAKRPKVPYDAKELTNWINKDSINTLKEVINKQAKFYFDAEADFFKIAKTNYLCAIYFERIKNMEDLNFLDPIRVSETLEDIFYTVFHFENSTDNGLAVYGLIKECPS